MRGRQPTLCIDFGTSNSLVGAVVEGEKIFDIPLDPSAEDPTLFRTLIYFPNGNEAHYGSEAKSQYLIQQMSGRLFRSFKSHLPNPNYLGTFVDDRVLRIEDLVGLFLLEIKRRAEKHLNVKFDSVILGRPARYSLDPVRDKLALHRMEKAAEFARFTKVEFVPEPLAAAFDYAQTLTDKKTVLVGDFGGGTSDFTVIRIGAGQYSQDDVLAVEGCPLAGDALDSLFMKEKLNVHFGAKVQYRMPMSKNVLSMPPAILERLNLPAHIVHLSEKSTYEFIKEIQKCALNEESKAAIHKLFVLIEDQLIFDFFETIEKTKRALSRAPADEFLFSYPELVVKETFLRTDFEMWAHSILRSLTETLERSMSVSQCESEDIDWVYLTGGSALVPCIRDLFQRKFGEAKIATGSQFHSIVRGLVEWGIH